MIPLFDTMHQLWASYVYPTWQLIFSAVSFWPTLKYNSYASGRSCNFNAIAGDVIAISNDSEDQLQAGRRDIIYFGNNSEDQLQADRRDVLRRGNSESSDVVEQEINNGICIGWNSRDELVFVNDNKKRPLVLGSIPQKEDDIDSICKTHLDKIENHNGSIGAKPKMCIISMNEKFEQDWSGLTQLLRHNRSIRFHDYPTRDGTAPSLANLVAAVNQLDKRDESLDELVYVHCKAGKGRSACVVAAYIALVIHRMNPNRLCSLSSTKRRHITVQTIESYLKHKRPVVHLNVEQRKVVEEFMVMLDLHKDFDLIYKAQQF